MTGTLVLLRHGESEWNAKNLFTGWVDVDLNSKGETEARRGGELLKESGLLPDVVHTSVLLRAIHTSEIALKAADRHWIPVRRSWRLNERHYGALQGKDKKQTLQTYGEEQFMLWRRSYDVPPPPIDDADEFSQAGDARYAALPPGSYRCRTVHLRTGKRGATVRATPPGFCYVSGEEQSLGFSKQTGADIAAGYFYPDGKRYVFLGARQRRAGDNSFAYGADRTRDLVGVAERFANFRWRLAVPGPREGDIDVYELTPVPAEQQPKS